MALLQTLLGKWHFQLKSVTQLCAVLNTHTSKDTFQSFYCTHARLLNGYKSNGEHCSSRRIHTSPCVMRFRRVNRLKLSSVLVHFVEEIQCKTDFIMSFNEWEILRKRIVADSEGAENATDLALMNIAMKQNKPDLAKSLKEFLESNGELNLETRSAFMLACCKKYEDLVVEEIEKLEQDERYKIMPPVNAIKAILQTREWKRAIPVYEARCNSQIIGPDSLSLDGEMILETALKWADYDLFFCMLLEMSSSRYSSLPKFKLRSSRISSLLWRKWSENCFSTEVFLELMKHPNLYLKQEEAEQLAKICMRNDDFLNCDSSTIKLPDSWRCSKCGEDLLLEESITDEEVRQLADQLAQSNFKTDRKYYTTTQDDDDKFIQIMKKSGPFDYVIDGENLVFGLKRKVMDVKYETLLDKIMALQRSGKKILIVHRLTTFKSKRNAPAEYFRVIDNFCTVYLLSRKTMDDVYSLLAAMWSGRDCYLVSNDYFRDHVALLGPREREVFYRWQRRCHVRLDNHQWKYPNPRCITHESESGWHVPFHKAEDYDQKWAQFLSPSNTYLCIQKKQCYNPSPEVQAVREARNKAMEQYGTERIK